LKLLKKYPNRRIYDTTASRFITNSDVRQMVLNYELFQVVDSKTGADLTRATLLQIITEQEDQGRGSLLTNRVLEELIRFYGDHMSEQLGGYVETAVCTLLEQQGKLRGQVKQILNLSPVPLVTEMTKQYTRFWKSVLTPSAGRKQEDSKVPDGDKSTP
jgi:polyhydroxyalkanoate synthesis repressor PhaR